MADIALLWRTTYGGDLQVSGPSLLAEDGLQSAVVLSLFLDRRAEPGDELPGLGPGANTTASRRGWWGDSYADAPGDLIGSRLWLLAREKQMPSVLRRAEDYAREALQWLVDDGVARAVSVVAERLANGTLALAVTIERSDRPVASYRFESFWKGG